MVTHPALDLRLEPFGEQHLDEVSWWLTDPDVVRFTRVPAELPGGFARAWLGRYQAGRVDGSREAFAVLDGSTVVALALAPHVDRGASEVELGYIVGPDARGRGVATQSLLRLTEWAFVEAGVLRAYLLVDVDNAASNRVAEKAGYVREGVMRSLHLKGDLRSDTVLWSRLPTDPPAP